MRAIQCFACFLWTLGMSAPVWGQDDAAPDSVPAYLLEVVKMEATQRGLSRYEIHLQLPEGHRVSALFGTDTYPMTLHAPKGVFNSPYNGSWSATGMNAKFFDAMPTMQDDTYATIGLRTGARASGIEGAADPTMVQDPGNPWDDFFTQDGETTLAIDTHTGGSWFVLRSATNGAPVDGHVLLLQVSTPGKLSGAINVQVFPLVPEYSQLRMRFEFDGEGLFQGTIID